MDPIQKNIINLMNSGGDSNQIVQQLLNWRANFSINWYQKYFNSESKNKLADLWRLFFELTGLSDPTISVATFNVIGAFLVAISPFHSVDLIRSFAQVVPEVPVSSNTSIAVISIFAYLSNQLPPFLLSTYLDQVSIFHHFNIDLKDYIQYVPNLISQMSRLSLDNHKQVLRTLLTSFGRKPVPAFIDSIFCVLQYNPRRLMNDLMEFIISNKLHDTLLAIGTKLVSTPSLFCLLRPEQLDLIFTLAKESLNKIDNISSASELEMSIGIIRSLMSKTNRLQEAANQFAFEINQKQFPIHIKRNLYPIVTNIQDLMPDESDSSNILATKLNALINFGEEYDKTILEIIASNIGRRDDVFIASTDLFSKKFEGFDKRKNDPETLTKILKSMVTGKNYTWVQQEAVISFIKSNNQYICAKYFKDYIKMAVKFIVATAISKHESLVGHAMKCASKFVGYNNISYFMKYLMDIDFFDSYHCLRLVQILNNLIENIDSPQFEDFVPIVFELILYDPTQAYVAECFNFLSHFNNLTPDPKIELICLTKLKKLLMAFTQMQFKILPNDEVTEPSLLSNITTDIVADPSQDYHKLLEPLHQCYKYMMVCPPTIISPYNLAEILVDLYPIECLEYISKHNDHYENRIEIVINKVRNIFETNPNWGVSSSCLNYIFQQNHSSVLSEFSNVFDTVMHSKVITDPNIAFSFFSVLFEIDQRRAISGSLCILTDLNPVDAAEFAIKICSQFKTEFTESLAIMYPACAIDTAALVAYDWFKQANFNTWPISNPEYVEKLLRLFEANPKITIDKFDELDDEKHWKFLMSHKDLFEIDGLDQFLIEHPNRIRRIIDLSEICINNQYLAPDLNEIIINTPKLPSATPLLRRGIIIDSTILLRNFVLFSKLKITQDIFDKLVILLPDEKENLKKYSNKHNLQMEITEISHPDFVDNLVIKAKYFKQILIYFNEHKGSFEEINLFVNAVFAQIDDIEKPKVLFFFFRTIATVLNYTQVDNSLKQAFIDKIHGCLDEHLSSILNNADYSICLELSKVFLLVMNTLEQDALSTSFPVFEQRSQNYLISHIEDYFKFEIPSYALLAIRACDFTPYTSPFVFIEPQLKKFLTQPFVNQQIINFMARHVSMMTHDPQIQFAYLTNFLDPYTPMLELSGALVSILMASIGPQILDFEKNSDFFKDLVTCGYSYKGIIEMVVVYYHLQIIMSPPETQIDLKIQEMKLCQEIFLKNPANLAISFASCLIANAADSQGQFIELVNKAKQGDMNFGFIYTIIQKYTKAMKESHEKFNETITEIANELPLLSRGKSLEFLSKYDKKYYDAAFLCAFSDTNNIASLESIFCTYNIDFQL